MQTSTLEVHTYIPYMFRELTKKVKQNIINWKERKHGLFEKIFHQKFANRFLKKLMHKIKAKVCQINFQYDWTRSFNFKTSDFDRLRTPGKFNRRI